ncbi:hypothetical protein [Sphaerisporangium sp. TRM90804]|uniref:WXG100 family type VII secretion target n=1 Tax=Sphaerisporangium sp. TRM90804 TaxID=3031113 RepID=UPI002449D072|nr:hypothetical protein [Sphaerisporangium sp. TRM90804]MDH2425087.1 hypothetical protein [Sphaerisporangium sp. TRM90804]
MSYESGTTLYTVGLAGIGAFSVLNPRGWPIFLLAGASVSNPGEMDKASKEWHSVAADFQTLGAELTKLAGSVPEDKWTAEDRAAFESSVTLFKQELAKGGEIHKGMGDSMENMANLYFAFAVMVFAVGGILLALVGAVAAAMATGVGAAPAQAAAGAIATGLHKIVALAQKRKLVALGVATGLFFAIQMWNQGKQMELQQKGMNANGSGIPMFTQANLNLGGGLAGLPGDPAVPGLPGAPAAPGQPTVPGLPPK